MVAVIHYLFVFVLQTLIQKMKITNCINLKGRYNQGYITELAIHLSITNLSRGVLFKRQLFLYCQIIDYTQLRS